MASTTNVSGRVKQQVASFTSKQEVRQKVTEFIKAHFANTLGQAPDIVNIFMALMQRESSFNPTAKGPAYGQSHVTKILGYTAIKTKYAQGSALEKANITNAAAAFGLAQVTGYYCIKSCGPGGKCELERLRPDICTPILIVAGGDVKSKLTGASTLDNQILAGLIVLEDKYKNVAPKLVKSGKFSNRLTAAVAAYLGLGTSDSLGTTPEAYANSIIRGSAYQIANNGFSPDGKALTASASGSAPNKKSETGPVETIASGNNLSTAGCA